MKKRKTTANALSRVSPSEDDEQRNLHHGKAVEGPEAQVLGVFILEGPEAQVLGLFILKRRENGRNVTSFRAWPLWPATWVGYELGGSALHQCR